MIQWLRGTIPIQRYIVLMWPVILLLVWFGS